MKKLVTDAENLKHIRYEWQEAVSPKNIMATITFHEDVSVCLIRSNDKSVLDRFHTSSHKRGKFGSSVWPEKRESVLKILNSK